MLQTASASSIEAIPAYLQHAVLFGCFSAASQGIPLIALHRASRARRCHDTAAVSKYLGAAPWYRVPGPAAQAPVPLSMYNVQRATRLPSLPLDFRLLSTDMVVLQRVNCSVGGTNGVLRGTPRCIGAHRCQHAHASLNATPRVPCMTVASSLPALYLSTHSAVRDHVVNADQWSSVCARWRHGAKHHTCCSVHKHHHLV